MKCNILCSCVFVFLAANFLVSLSSELLTDVKANEPIKRSRRDISDSATFYYQEPLYPRDCEEVYEQCEDVTESGIYMIQPESSPEPFKVFCNNSVDGGKWTVFQRRVDGSVDFYRNWNEFKKGFGFLSREFWLGNDNLAHLTSQKDYELRIDMNNVNGVSYFAKYDLFRISDEWSKYRLVDLGEYLSESTANYDAMAHQRNMSFTTYDQDNDGYSGNCASHSNIRGAWWHNGWSGSYCRNSNLNALYFGCSGCYRTIYWYNLPGSYYNIKYVEMKVRAR